MRTIARHAELLPLLDVDLGYVAVMFSVSGAVEELGELAEGFDTDDAFECEVGLEGKPAGEIVGGY